MSFCRITGKCRSLPKPNYFPMLPPISPADAKRFCRVTGKSFGLPSHHFIPVRLIRVTRTEKCKVTNVAAELDPHHYQPGTYGNRKHVVVCEFRYVFPILDDGDEAQKNLISVLDQKTKPIEQNLYVYKVDERNFGLVFPARLEAAVRDGDVRDVMLAKESDKLLIKLRKGNSVSVCLKNVEQADLEKLYEGEGPRDEVVKKREKEDAKRPKPKSKSTLSNITNVFEQKEKIQDLKEQEERNFIEAHHEKAVRLSQERRERQLNEKLNALKLNEHLITQESELGDLVKPMIESWDWNTLEKEASENSNNAAAIKALPEPLKIAPVDLPSKQLNVDQAVLEKSSGLEAASYVGQIKPSNIEIKTERLNAMKSLPSEVLVALSHVEEKLAAQSDLFPHLDDLASVISRVHDSQTCTVDGVPGAKLIVNHQEIFVPGQTLMFNNKPTFVPGQTIECQNGLLEFIPGATITTHDGAIRFIPGEISLTKAGKPQNFVAGKMIDGKFVCGQVMIINDEPQFVQGQTIVTPEGVTKFVAGIFDQTTGTFVPGQNIETPEGIKFIPGQTITVNGKEKFIPGQTVMNKNKEMVFVPGQTVVNEQGSAEFIPGKTIVTAEGSKFIPGQYVGETFVPGISGADEFIPGVNIETKEGSKFVQGQIVHTKHGDVFMPGTTSKNENGEVKFDIASTIDAVRFSEATPVVLVLDSESLKITEPSLCVFGHMVQHKAGVEFFPEQIKKEDLPQGKTVPGNLVKQISQAKFIPGIKAEDGFIPGQAVLTEHGEQFVPGQVIETSEGLKFVPGQIIETKTGAKFVPGQTMQTAEGPLFVPGQIIKTKAGPTFIPGQVICTDDDGEKFVPGQIVDTEDGPRFVPGRVVETENKVTFIPGRIVQTADGPKFVAPDLKDTEDGAEEFLVQSFAVTPEELKLLKPSHNLSMIDPEDSLLLVTLDSSMLQQLSEAGMNVGRQVEASAVDYVLESTKERKTLRQFIVEQNIPNGSTDVLENIFDGLKAVCKRVDLQSLQCNVDEPKPIDIAVCNGSIGVVESLATSLAAVLGNTSKNENRNMYEVIAEAMKQSNGEYSIEELQHVMESPAAMEYLAVLVNRTVVKNKIDQKLKTLTTLVEDEVVGKPVKKHVIETSKDIPDSLFYTNNQLAIDDFFLTSDHNKRHSPKALLIIKQGIQTVIPRESSHEVLAGKIAYTVLDEHGIRHFQPKNVLNALKITPRFVNRFSLYTCDICEEPDHETLSSCSSHRDGEFDNVHNYRSLPKRSSLFITNGGCHHRRGDRLNNYQVTTTPQNTPLTHRKPTKNHLPQRPLQLRQPLYYVGNVKTLPMAMRIAIKASLSREAPTVKASSRDYLRRSSTFSQLK